MNDLDQRLKTLLLNIEAQEKTAKPSEVVPLLMLKELAEIVRKDRLERETGRHT